MNVEALKAGIAKFHLGFGPDEVSGEELVGWKLGAYSMGYDNRVNNQKPQPFDASECPEYAEGYDACEVELAKY